MESVTPPGGFMEVQDYLRNRDKIGWMQDAEKRDRVILARARLLRDAKEAGIFDSLKRQIEDTQRGGDNFEIARTAIAGIEIPKLESETRALPGWRDDFLGMFGEYRDVSLLVMDLAKLKAEGKLNTSAAQALQKEIGNRSWGTVPDHLATNLIKRETERSAQTGTASAGTAEIAKLLREFLAKGGGALDAREFAGALALEQGIMKPSEYLEIYRRAEEEYYKVPIVIAPGSEPRFWPIISEKERKEWYVRATLSTICYKKSNATGTDKLYMDEMKELAVSLNKSALKTIFAKEGVLPTVGIYAEIIGGEKFLRYKDKRNQSLKDVFCTTISNKGTEKALVRDYGEANVRRLKELQTRLYAGCPDSIYPHNDDPKKHGWGTNINQESFRVMKESVRFWLVTKGRDLLLTREELNNRDEFFRDKDKVLETLWIRARDAEQIGWNFAYATSWLEHFDSRAYRPEGTKRHGPSEYWCLFQWIPMHIQERWEQKIVRGGQGGEPDLKEEWAGSLGTWATWNVSQGNWPVREIPITDENGRVIRGKSIKKVEFPRILPDVIFKDALHPSIYERERLEGADLRRKEQEEKRGERPLFDTVREIGEMVLFNTANANRGELEGGIDWTGMSDAPFVPFIYDEMRWADVITNVFKKGAESKLHFDDIGEAMRNLRIPIEDRKKLIIIFFGVKAKSRELRTGYDKLAWTGMMRYLLKDYPNLLTELR